MQPLFLFKLLGVPFFSFPTLTVTGVALAWLMAQRPARAAGWPALWVSEAMACAALCAMLLGRVGHVGYNIDYFVERPTQMWRFGDGGLSFVGLSVGGALGLWGWSRWRGLRVLQVVDVGAAPLALLAALAWLGAFFHGSQYGAPADHDWALELRDTYGVILARWPTQLLAAGWSALCALSITTLRRWRGVYVAGRKAGWLISAYSVGLFCLDFTRGDASIIWLGLRLTQWLYLVAGGIGLFWLGRSSE